MEDQGIQVSYKSRENKEAGFDKSRRAALIPFLLLFFSLALLIPESSFGAEKKVKKQPAQKEVVLKDSIMTDANVQASFKKAEELLKKGDADGSQKIFVKVYDYTKEALTTMTFIQGQYDKLVNDPSTNQSEKEDIYIKLQRVKQVTAKYSSIKSASAYNLGYIYTKKGDPEKARKFLAEVVETTPFSTRKGSTWMKAKTLLLELYGLEGEF
jgi:tetratricopeptide (TPR) repeat protein